MCDKGGECPLQDYSYTFGPDNSRMEFPRRVFDGEGVRGDVDFGPTLMLNRQRCILCTRCVRFMGEVDGDAQIGIIEPRIRQRDRDVPGRRRSLADLRQPHGRLPGRCHHHEASTASSRGPGTTRTAADTICTMCSKGCNTNAWIKAKPEWAKGSRLIRMTPRFNPDVNGYWMCDIGRFDFGWIEGDDRLQKPLMRGAGGAQQPGTWREVTAKLADALACGRDLGHW